MCLALTQSLPNSLGKLQCHQPLVSIVSCTNMRTHSPLGWCFGQNLILWGWLVPTGCRYCGQLSLSQWGAFPYPALHRESFGPQWLHSGQDSGSLSLSQTLEALIWFKFVLGTCHSCLQGHWLRDDPKSLVAHMYALLLPCAGAVRSFLSQACFTLPCPLQGINGLTPNLCSDLTRSLIDGSTRFLAFCMSNTREGVTIQKKQLLERRKETQDSCLWVITVLCPTVGVIWGSTYSNIWKRLFPLLSTTMGSCFLTSLGTKYRPWKTDALKGAWASLAIHLLDCFRTTVEYTNLWLQLEASSLQGF